MARGCQHPTLPCLEPLFTGAFPALQGTGQGLSPQTRGQSSGLREAVLGVSTHCMPVPGKGCPITWEEWCLSLMGHSHLWKGVPAWWGVAGSARE